MSHLRTFASIAILFLLSACTSIPNFNELNTGGKEQNEGDQGAETAEKVVSPQNTLVQSSKPIGNDVEFERKQKCQTFVDEIKAILKKNDEEMFYDEDMYYRSRLDKVFYSNSRNSCLYYVTETMYGDGKPETESFLLFDFLENELLLSGGATYKQNRQEARERFERSMEKYN